MSAPSFIGRWSSGVANTLSTTVSAPAFLAIFDTPSMSTSSSTGLVGVSKKNGLIVTGSNCLAVGIKSIQAGVQYGTGTQAPQVEAALAVKVATQILNGGKPPKVSYVQEQRITKANVAKFTRLCTF